MYLFIARLILSDFMKKYKTFFQMSNKNCLSSQNLCLEAAKIWGKSLGRRFYAKASATEAEAEG